MPLAAIVQIIARLFALSWLFGGLIGMAYGFSELFKTDNLKFTLYNLAPSGIQFVAAAIFWFAIPSVSRLVVGKPETIVPMGGITRHQLFTAVLLGVGAWHTLSHFGDFFNACFYLSKPENRANMADAPESFYKMTNSILSFLIGVALLFTCQKIARKFPLDEPASDQ